MGHRGSDDGRCVEVARLEPVDELGHQSGDLLRVGAPIGEAAIAAGHADRTFPPQAGAFVSLEVAGIEVQVEDHAVEPAEVRIARHHADVVHRTGVAGQRHPAFVLGAGRLLAGDELRGLVRGNVEALDRDRALGRACANLPAQAAEPGARATGLGAEALSQLLELVELGP